MIIENELAQGACKWFYFMLSRRTFRGHICSLCESAVPYLLFFCHEYSPFFLGRSGEIYLSLLRILYLHIFIRQSGCSFVYLTDSLPPKNVPLTPSSSCSLLNFETKHVHVWTGLLSQVVQCSWCWWMSCCCCCFAWYKPTTSQAFSMIYSSSSSNRRRHTHHHHHHHHLSYHRHRYYFSCNKISSEHHDPTMHSVTIVEQWSGEYHDPTT